MFGFDIEILDKLRRQIIKNKRPYDLVSNSQQNRRLSILGKDMDSTITPLFHEHNFVSSETKIPAKLLEVKIEINEQIILFVCMLVIAFTLVVVLLSQTRWNLSPDLTSGKRNYSIIE